MLATAAGAAVDELLGAFSCRILCELREGHF